MNHIYAEAFPHGQKSHMMRSVKFAWCTLLARYHQLKLLPKWFLDNIHFTNLSGTVKVEIVEIGILWLKYDLTSVLKGDKKTKEKEKGLLPHDRGDWANRWWFEPKKGFPFYRLQVL